MSPLRYAAIALLCTALAACAGFPPYLGPAPGLPTARIDLQRAHADTLCVGGKLYSLTAPQPKVLVVPAVGRVGLYSFASIADYNVTYTCMPGISFKPVPDETYLLNFENDSKACHLEVYHEGAANRIGLDVEPSVGNPAYCK